MITKIRRQFYKSEKLHKHIPEALQNIGVLHFRRGHLDKAYKCFEESSIGAQKFNARYPQSTALGNMGLIHLIRGEFSDAVKIFNQVLFINEEIGDKKIISQSYGNIGISYKGTEIGSGSLTFQVEASNGKIKSIDVPLYIQRTDFDFEVLFSKTENYVNELTDFSININQNTNENLTYKTYFKNIEGFLRIGDEEVQSNRMIEVFEGTTYGDFRATKNQNSEIEFVVEASNGISKSKIVSYTFLKIIIFIE